MAKSKVKISNEKIRKTKELGQLIAKKMAISTRDDLAQEANYAIDMFYENYIPKYYYRHGNPNRHNSGLYQTFHKHFKNSHSSTYYGGIIFSTKNMLPSNSSDGYYGTQEQVFNSFWNGFHGVPTLGIWSAPTPHEHMEKVFDMIVQDLPNRSNWALEEAMKELHWED